MREEEFEKCHNRHGFPERSCGNEGAMKTIYCGRKNAPKKGIKKDENSC
jgi:hypothetical protein